MVSKFQKFCDQNGIFMGIIVIILATIITLLLPILAYGIGYLVKYNVLWIWNYKTKSYVDENDPNVYKIYNEIKEFIENKL